MTKSTGKQFIHRYMSLEERFWMQTDVTNYGSCWEWKGSCKKDGGYGQLNVDGVPRHAHRVSWIINNGNIPDDLHVLHKCDNRKCVNPGHLFLGTNDDNVDDKVYKNRQSKGTQRPAHKLDDNKVKRIREMYLAGEVTQSRLGELFGVSNSQINLVVNHKSWKHVGG